VAPLASARFYVWGFENTTGGFVGNINLSTSDGLFHESASTTMGIYSRLNAQPEFLRRVNGDSTFASGPTYAAGDEYDLRIDYDGSSVSHFRKLSSSNTWIQIGVARPYTGGAGDYYLNISSIGRAFTIGVDSEWYIDQIDITDLGHDVLTAPVPEPAMISLAGIGALALLRRRQAL